MRVLQTLGRHKLTNQEGIFQYRRDHDGVYLDFSVGLTTSLPATAIRFAHAQWTSILTAFANQPNTTFRLTASNAGQVPPFQSVYDTLKNCGTSPTDAAAGGNVAWHDSYCAAVAAVLEHEGSLDLYAGPLGPHGGQQHSTPIHLAKDF